MCQSDYLQRGPERPLLEAVKVKPMLSWSPLVVRDARSIGHLAKKAVDIKQEQPRRGAGIAIGRRAGKARLL